MSNSESEKNKEKQTESKGPVRCSKHNIPFTEVSEEKRMTERLFKNIMAKIFPDVMKNVNLQIQAAQ